MYELLIVGARGYGREVCDWASSCIGYGDTFRIKGFLDDDASALDGFEGYPPILGPVETYSFEGNDRFVVALGEPKMKRHYANIALRNGGIPMSLVDRAASVGRGTAIGQGCLILGNSLISVNCSIGDYVSVNYCTYIGHDSAIGDFCHVGAFGFTGGGVCLGALVTMHPRVSVLPHKKVGDEAILGAGSVCLDNVQCGTTVAGVPARTICTNSSAE